jgi:methyl-accepting chemotaxis protein
MHFSIGKKIAIVFGIVFALNVMAAIFSYIKLDELAKDQRAMNETMFPALEASLSVRAELYRANSATRGFVLMGSDPALSTGFKSDFESAWQNISANQSKLQELTATFQNQENKDRVRILGESLPELHNIQQETLQAASTNDTEGAAKAYDLLLDKAVPAAAKIVSVDTDLNESVRQVVTTAQQRMETERAATVWVLALSTLFSIGCGATLAFVISRRIVGSVTAVAARAASIAQGDLTGETLEVLSDDELGELTKAVNQMQSSLTEMMISIGRDAENLASASEQLSNSATQQAQGSQTQTDQTQQVATAIHEMSATVQEVSSNSMQAASKAVQTADTARHGGKVVEDVLSTMRSIADSVGSTARKIEELGKSSDRIGTIIAVIDEIADQTNLLALNAAIEAARAGEQGRGFAVVADEVRKLAERTTSATKEIAQMITNVQGETKTAVTEMELGTKKVDAGVETTTQAGDALKEIISAAQQVGDMINQIATAATEQASATDQIKASVESIAHISQESASGAQQSAHACQELSALAMNLQQVVSRFHTSGQQRSQRGAANQRSREDLYSGSDDHSSPYDNPRVM